MYFYDLIDIETFCCADVDYGSLLCWGVNSVGQQLEPCVIHILPAGILTVQ
jgi:hypothetical protein